MHFFLVVVVVGARKERLEYHLALVAFACIRCGCERALCFRLRVFQNLCSLANLRRAASLSYLAAHRAVSRMAIAGSSLWARATERTFVWGTRARARAVRVCVISVATRLQIFHSTGRRAANATRTLEFDIDFLSSAKCALLLPAKRVSGRRARIDEIGIEIV